MNGLKHNMIILLYFKIVGDEQKMEYKIGDKTETGYIFDIQDNTIFECALEDHGEYSWCEAIKIFPPSIKDWRLPTKEELNLMYENLYKKGIGGFANNSYWSSSDFNALIAWVQNFTIGLQFLNIKYYTFRVRAVRAYKIETKPDELYELLKDPDYCLSEMNKIREQFNTLSKENFGELSKGIALIAVYCPIEMKGIILSLLDELTIRYKYIMDKYERKI
jgi:hypothetical protein